MSRIPALNNFCGIGRLPHSGMPGAPLGPAFRSTRTLLASTSRAGSSIRAFISSKLSKTMARPVCFRSLGSAAEDLMTAPVGARFPRKIASPPDSRTGLSNVRITSVL